MSRRGAIAWVEWGAIILIVIGAAMLAIQLNSYSNFRERFPDSLTIAGVDVGNLTEEEASRQVTAVYNSEVDLYYQGGFGGNRSVWAADLRGSSYHDLFPYVCEHRHDHRLDAGYRLTVAAAELRRLVHGRYDDLSRDCAECPY